MITWLLGENSFEVREALRAIEGSFDGAAERIDGASLTLAQLPDIFMGVSLFAQSRLVIVSDISTNSAIWDKLPDWLDRVSDEVHLVLVDAKADKRTAVYKAVKAAANVQEFTAWGDRDLARATSWLQVRAKEQGVALSPVLAKQVVDRVGVNQWELASALDVLSLLDEITPQSIADVIPPNPQENVFGVFETALQGRRQQLASQLQVLSMQEDPYGFFALLSSQAFSLAALSFASDSDNPVKDFAIHPFVAQKMQRHADKLGRAKVARILNLFAKADADMKRSRGEPWLLIEKLLMDL